MHVSVAYAEMEKQLWLHLELDEGATVQDAIDRAGILKRFPHIDLGKQKVGIFGKLVELDHTLKDDDRVEIYRAIVADKNEVTWRSRDESQNADKPATGDG